MSGFVARNKPEWDELEALVGQARKSLRRMTPEELSRLDLLYRRTTQHLSQVLTRTNDAQLIHYLNDLTAAAHSLIYLPPRASVWTGCSNFLMEGFARLIVRRGRYHATSAALLLTGGLLGYFLSLHDALAAYALMMPCACDPRTPGATRQQLLEALRSGRDTDDGGKFLFASFLFSHNLKVGITAMGLGLLAAVPTMILMIYNGMLLGAFAAMHHRVGIDAELWAWILPHGIPELGAIVLFGGTGLLLGHAVVSPGRLTRAESLKRAGLDAAQTCVGAGGLLVLAAILESYLRQSHLSTTARLIVASVSALFWATFILYGYIRERAAQRTVNPDLTRPQREANLVPFDVAQARDVGAGQPRQARP